MSKVEITGVFEDVLGNCAPQTLQNLAKLRGIY